MAKKITTSITDDELRTIVAENAIGLKELREEIKKLKDASWKTDESIEKMASSVYSFIKKVDGTVGDYGSRLGEIMELVVIPGVRPAMHRLGRNFDRIVTNRKIKDPNNKKLVTEVDVLLVNGTEAMAVEIKAHLVASEVMTHVNRLKKLRAYEDKIDIKGKKLYGAIAGIVIDENARNMASDKGLYIIEILEDQSRLNAIAPTGKAATW